MVDVDRGAAESADTPRQGLEAELVGCGVAEGVECADEVCE